MIRLVAGAAIVVVLGVAVLILWPLLWPPDPDSAVRLVNGRLVGATSGYVGRVDRDARTVDVSSSLVGWRPVVLLVNEQTAIQIQERRGDMEDLVKDTPVRVSYEVVGDKRVAKSIEIVSDDPGRAVATDAAKATTSSTARPGETPATVDGGGAGAPGTSTAADVGAPPSVTPAAAPTGPGSPSAAGVAPPPASAAVGQPVPAATAPPALPAVSPPSVVTTVPPAPTQSTQQAAPAAPTPEKRPESVAPKSPTPEKRAQLPAPVKAPETKTPEGAPAKAPEAKAPEGPTGKRMEPVAPKTPAPSAERVPPKTAPAPTAEATSPRPATPAPDPRPAAPPAPPPAPRQEPSGTVGSRVTPPPTDADSADGSAAIDWLLRRR